MTLYPAPPLIQSHVGYIRAKFQHTCTFELVDSTGTTVLAEIHQWHDGWTFQPAPGYTPCEAADRMLDRLMEWGNKKGEGR